MAELVCFVAMFWALSDTADNSFDVLSAQTWVDRNAFLFYYSLYVYVKQTTWRKRFR